MKKLNNKITTLKYEENFLIDIITKPGDNKNTMESQVWVYHKESSIKSLIGINHRAKDIDVSIDEIIETFKEGIEEEISQYRNAINSIGEDLPIEDFEDDEDNCDLCDIKENCSKYKLKEEMGEYTEALVTAVTTYIDTSCNALFLIDRGVDISGVTDPILKNIQDIIYNLLKSISAFSQHETKIQIYETLEHYIDLKMYDLDEHGKTEYEEIEHHEALEVAVQIYDNISAISLK